MRKNPLSETEFLSQCSKRGFTLLEVMIAIAIMAMGLIILLQVQSRTMRLAEKGRAMVIASELARKKLLDCKADLIKKGFSIQDYSDEGDFSDEGRAEITWECHGTRFDMPAPSQDLIAQGMKAQGGGGPAKPGSEMGAAMLAPFFGLVANTLGDSARELSAIIRWKVGEETEEMQVTTHVVDSTALARVFSAIPDQVQLPPGIAPKAPNTGQQGGPPKP